MNRNRFSAYGLNRRVLLSALAVLPTFVGPLRPISAQAQVQTDALASWNDGATKQAITDFVARVTRQGGPNFVAPAERIACSTMTAPCGWSSRCTSNLPLRSTA
jgi:hypothetical protein